MPDVYRGAGVEEGWLAQLIAHDGATTVVADPGFLVFLGVIVVVFAVAGVIGWAAEGGVSDWLRQLWHRAR